MTGRITSRPSKAPSPHVWKISRRRRESIESKGAQRVGAHGLSCQGLFRSYAEQLAGTAVFEDPERALRPDLYVSNAMADVLAFRPLGSRAGDDDADEGPARQAAHQ